VPRECISVWPCRGIRVRQRWNENSKLFVLTTKQNVRISAFVRYLTISRITSSGMSLSLRFPSELMQLDIDEVDEFPPRLEDFLDNRNIRLEDSSIPDMRVLVDVPYRNGILKEICSAISELCSTASSFHTIYNLSPSHGILTRTPAARKATKDESCN
jgi:hypothetical protein